MLNTKEKKSSKNSVGSNIITRWPLVGKIHETCEMLGIFQHTTPNFMKNYTKQTL